MKSISFAAAIAGAMLIAGSAFAYHPTDRNIRGTLDLEQSERIEFEDVQRGVFRGGSSSIPARRRGRSAHSTHIGGDSRPPYLTEHHTR